MSAKDLLSLSEDDFRPSDSDDDIGKGGSKAHSAKAKSAIDRHYDGSESDSNADGSDVSEQEDEDVENESDVDEAKIVSGKRIGTVKPLNPAELAAKMDEIKRSGVVYLSSLPPYMKPVKLRQILARFGPVNRIFMTPEDTKSHLKRVRAGGNRKKKFTEGWAEFASKRDAKLAAVTLNGNKIGGKKGSFYYDDILNIKYLKKFKWTDLTEAIALEAQERQEKLKAEIAQATKENKIFIENVETKAMLDKIHAKKGKRDRDNEPRRTFTQRPSESKSAPRAKKHKSGEPKSDIDNVLSQVF